MSEAYEKAKVRKRDATLIFRVARAGSLPPDTGVFVPNDAMSERRAKAKRWKVGTVLSAVLKLARFPWYHRKAHVFGQLLSDNIERFAYADAHDVLKRLQLEADIGCDVMTIDAASMWEEITNAICGQAGEHLRPSFQVIGSFLKGVDIPSRTPRSLSFESMDQTEFEGVMKQMFDHVRRTYWPTADDETIEEMIRLMPENQ